MQKQKTRQKARLFLLHGGKGGIRTRGGLLTHTRFPGVRLKPLIHLSAKAGVYQADLLKPLARS